MNQPMMLKEIANYIDGKLVNYSENLRVDNISFSSNNIGDNTLFIAIKGYSVDGHKYIDDAFKNGAICVICEDDSYLLGRVGIVVKDSRYALSKLASIYYMNPSLSLIHISEPTRPY